MKTTLLVTVVLAALLAPSTRAITYSHLEVGIDDLNVNGRENTDPLGFYGELGVTHAPISEASKTLIPDSTGRYSDDGFSFNGSQTFAAYSFLDANGPTDGSFIRLTITGVTGPTGGIFALYDVPNTTNPTPTFTIAVGSAGSLGTFDLTAYDAAVSGSLTDPYGHIHGRRWAANIGGDFTVTFVATDTSGGTNHPASAPLTVTFNAVVPEPTSAVLLGLSAIGLALTRRR